MNSKTRQYVAICMAATIIFLYYHRNNQEQNNNQEQKDNQDQKNNQDQENNQDSCNLNSEKLLSALSSIRKPDLQGEKFVTNVESALKLKDKLAKRRTEGEKVRLNVGSNSQKLKGFESSNIDELNMLKVDDWQRLFANKEVSGADSLFAEHVWEHLTPNQVLQAAAASFSSLREGGHWRVAVPDGYFRNDWYQKYGRPGGGMIATQEHQVMYTMNTLPPLFELAGYEVTLLEYHDNTGKFHKAEYTEDGGRVGRTFENDPRNKGVKIPGLGFDPDYKNGSLMMTSLVFDAFKPLKCLNIIY